LPPPPDCRQGRSAPAAPPSLRYCPFLHFVGHKFTLRNRGWEAGVSRAVTAHTDPCNARCPQTPGPKRVGLNVFFSTKQWPVLYDFYFLEEDISQILKLSRGCDLAPPTKSVSRSTVRPAPNRYPNATQLSSLDFTINRFFLLNCFRPCNSIEIVRTCQGSFGSEVPSVLLIKERKN